MSSLKLRTLSGIVFVLLITGCIFIHPILFFTLFSLIEFVAFSEYVNMCNRVNIRPNRFFVYVSGLLIFTSGFLDFYFGFKFTYALALISISAMYITELYLKNENGLQNIAMGLFGILYISLPFTLLFYFPGNFHGNWNPKPVFLPFLMIWINDSFAYIFGISFGKHRLFPSVSPKKSWEGAVGGGIATLIIAYFIAPLMGLCTWKILAIGLIAVIFGTFGDLIESMMKRSTGIKDSGNIIPGHGGILDRIDSVLFTVPAIFIFLIFSR